MSAPLLEVEDAPSIPDGPMVALGAEGVEMLVHRLLTLHVERCEKGGVDCWSCEEAGRMGIARPA